MPEPTVQVPVSLIRAALICVDESNRPGAKVLARDLRALLSQPTPDAEPDYPVRYDDQGRARFGCSLTPSLPTAPCGRRGWMDETQDADNPCVCKQTLGHDGLHVCADCGTGFAGGLPAEPPSIEDLAPGTRLG